MTALLNIVSAFGLSAATGLNASLPLLMLSLLARYDLLTLAPPFDALASDVAFFGLLLIAGVELLIDKIPGADAIGHALYFPLSVTAGAVVFASQAGAISSTHPGLFIIAGLLLGGATSGAIHSIRAAIRPATHVMPVPLLGPAVSVTEDVASLALVGAATVFPPLVPVILIAGAVSTFFLARFLVRTGGKLIRWIADRFGLHLPWHPASKGGQSKDNEWPDEDGEDPWSWPDDPSSTPAEDRDGWAPAGRSKVS